MRDIKLVYNGALGDTACLAYAIKYLKEIGVLRTVHVRSNYPRLFNGLCSSNRIAGPEAPKVVRSAPINSVFKNHTYYKMSRDLYYWTKFKVKGYQYISWYRTYIDRDKPLLEIFLRALHPSINLSNLHEYSFKPWLKLQHNLDLPRNKIVLAPEAGWACRELRPDAVKKLLAANGLVHENIVVVGVQPKDDYFSQFIDLRGKINFDELLYILNNSSKIITADSGIFHLASLLKKDMIAFFGPVFPTLRQYPNNNTEIMFRSDLLCGGCSARVDISRYGGGCPLGHNLCLELA